jgi:hypothetical protein
MTHTAPQLSRWVLTLEMLLCFVPLTLLFFTIAWYSAKFRALDNFGYLSVAALGPVGFIVAFRAIVLNRPSLPRPAIIALCALAIWTPVAYTLHVLGESGSVLGQWREVILVGLLPALAAVHLVFLARSEIKPADPVPHELRG